MCYILLLSLRIAPSEEEKQVLALLRFWGSPHLLGGVLRVLCNIHVMYVWGETQGSRGIFLGGHRNPRAATIAGVFALCPKSFSRSAGGLALAGPTQRKACGGHSCEVERYLLKSGPRCKSMCSVCWVKKVVLFLKVTLLPVGQAFREGSPCPFPFRTPTTTNTAG